MKIHHFPASIAIRNSFKSPWSPTSSQSGHQHGRRRLRTSTLPSLALLCIIVCTASSAEAQIRSAEGSWSTEFAVPGINGSVECAAEWNGMLVVGGKFRYVDGQLSRNVAAWSGTDWVSLGTGVDFYVKSIAVFDGQLVASGHTDDGRGAFRGRVERWDGFEWHPLLPASAPETFGYDALLVADDGLYVGGSHRKKMVVWKWDGVAAVDLSTEIETDLETNFSIRTLAMFHDSLYAAGYFYEGWEYAETFYSLARLTETGWTLIDGPVRDAEPLLPIGDVLWAAGFDQNETRAPQVAAWNGEEWQTADPPLPDGWSWTSKFVSVGARTFAIGNRSSGRPGITELLEHSWVDLDSGLGEGSVLDLVGYGDALVAIGSFVTVAGALTDGVAIHTGGTWHPIPIGDGGAGFRGSLRAFADNGENTVACGCYTRAGVRAVRNLAEYQGDGWGSLGPGSIRCALSALKVDDGLLVGGMGLTIPGVSGTTNLALWTGEGWQALGDGPPGDVRAICRYGSDIIAAGQPYDDADGRWGSNVFRWDGQQWHRMSAGMWYASVRALVVFDGTLYAGGEIKTGLGPTRGVARWSGFRWEIMEGGPGGGVGALVEHEGTLVAGGHYEWGGGWEDLTRLIGGRWERFPNRTPSLRSTDALASQGRILAAATRQLRIDDRTNQPMVWDGNTWWTLGDGVDGRVRALSIRDNGLWVGGEFTEADGRASNGVAFWSEVPHPVPVHELTATRALAGTVRVRLHVEDPEQRARFYIHREAFDGDTRTDRRVLTARGLTGDGNIEFVDESAPAGRLRYLVDQQTGFFGSEISAQAEVAASSPATVTNATALRSEDGVILTWVVSDRDSRGSVHVFREGPDSTREQVTPEPFRGEGEFSFVDRAAPPVALRYYVQMLRVGEGPLWVGPIEVRELAPAQAGGIQARRVARGALLTWEVFDPDRRAHFHVTRGAADGIWTRLTTDSLAGHGVIEYTDASELDPPIWYLVEFYIDGVLRATLGPVELPKPAGVPLYLELVPNPAREVALIRYGLPADGPVDLRLYDASGRRVSVLVSEMKGPGNHELSWLPRSERGGLSPGVYLLRMKFEGRELTSKLIWLP